MKNKIIINFDSIDIDSAYRLVHIVDNLIRKNVDEYLIKKAKCELHTNIN